jgi:hypothetical protein
MNRLRQLSAVAVLSAILSLAMTSSSVAAWYHYHHVRHWGWHHHYHYYGYHYYGGRAGSWNRNPRNAESA